MICYMDKINFAQAVEGSIQKNVKEGKEDIIRSDEDPTIKEFMNTLIIFKKEV